MKTSFDARFDTDTWTVCLTVWGLKAVNRCEFLIDRKMLLQPDAFVLTVALRRQLLGSLDLPEQQSGYQGDRERAAAQEEEKRGVSAPMEEQRWEIFPSVGVNENSREFDSVQRDRKSSDPTKDRRTDRKGVKCAGIFSMCVSLLANVSVVANVSLI